MSKWEESWKVFEARLPKNEVLETELLKQVFDRHTELLLDAILHIGKCHNVQVPIGYAIGGNLSGCRVNYNSKMGKFTFIQYPVFGKRGGGPYAKRIEL